ncbi:MAG: ileS, partial [Chlamydiales bacterium]|nr:ileS [Chlamydiales bacterium]
GRAVFGEDLEISAEEVSIQREVSSQMVAATEGTLTVALDTALNEELILEGLAREIVNKVNTMRREMQYAVTDRIEVVMETSDHVQLAFQQFSVYICQEILADQVSFGEIDGREWDLNGSLTKISIKKSEKSI